MFQVHLRILYEVGFGNSRGFIWTFQVQNKAFRILQVLVSRSSISIYVCLSKICFRKMKLYKFTWSKVPLSSLENSVSYYTEVIRQSLDVQNTNFG